MPTKIETKALEAACEKATDKLEIDWDGDEPDERSDSVDTAVEAAIRAYHAALMAVKVPTMTSKAGKKRIVDVVAQIGSMLKS